MSQYYIVYIYDKGSKYNGLAEQSIQINADKKVSKWASNCVQVCNERIQFQIIHLFFWIVIKYVESQDNNRWVIVTVIYVMAYFSLICKMIHQAFTVFHFPSILSIIWLV